MNTGATNQMKVVLWSNKDNFKTVGYVSTVFEFYDKYMRKDRIHLTIEEWIEYHNNAFGEDCEHLISRHSSVLNEITLLIQE